MPTLASRAASALKAFGHTVSSAISALSIARDAFFSFDGMLLKGNTGDVSDTTKEQAPASLIDYSGNNLQLTANGTTRPSKFSPINPGYYSFYLDGSTLYSASYSSALEFGTGDFTIEWWQYLTGAAFGTQNGMEMGMKASDSTNGWVIYRNTSVNTNRYSFRTGGGSDYVSTVTPATGKWEHWVITRASGTLQWYCNGVPCGTTANVTTNITDATATFYVGRAQTWTTTAGKGYYAGLRIVKGVAIYSTTTPFTPPTSPLTNVQNTTLLFGQSPYINDSAGTVSSFTLTGTTNVTQFCPYTIPTTYDFYGSQYFNGSTDYVTFTAPTTLTALGANNFTIECWVYLTSAGAAQYIVDARTSGSWCFGWGLITSGQLAWYTGAAGVFTYTGVGTNAWYHIAVVRSGTTMTLYVNGVSVQTGTDSTNYTATSGTFYIGSRYNVQAGSLFTGYMSNLKIVNGAAVYTTNFTPDAILSSTTGTQLLTFQYNGNFTNNNIVDYSNYNALITRTGRMTSGTMSPYTGIYSLNVSGSNWLYTPSNTLLNFGTNDFTVEYWVYITGFGNGYCGWCMWDNGASTARFTLGVQSNGAGTDSGYGLAFGTPTQVNTVTVNLNTWTHIALTRKGSDWRWYTNGVNNQYTTSSATFSPASVQTTIGNYPSSYATGTGYISNLRVVNGTALYSGSTSFTPSAIPLGMVPNTVLLMGTDGSFTDKARNLPISVSGTPSTIKLSPFAPSLYTQNQGYYSTFFTTSWLVTPSSSLYNVGTQDFTVEMWYYMTATGSYTTLFNLGAYNTGIFMRIDSTTYDMYIVNSQVYLTGTAPLNQWVHLALVRKTNNLYLWANGVQVGTTVANSTSISPTAALMIGTSAHATGESFTGYISNLRFVIGTGLYTSAFTPPTSPLTAIAGTVFLGLNNSTHVDSSTVAATITTGGGTPRLTMFSPFTTQGVTVTGGTITSPYTSSGSFIVNSTADYGMIPHNTIYDFSTGGSWSIEAWIYTTGASSAYRTIIAKRNAVASWEIFIAVTTNYFGFYNGTQYLTSIPILNNIWYHVAACYDGATMRLFVNGVQGYSGAVNAVTGTDNIYIGGAYFTSAMNESFVGYISDLRVVRGRALYTATFIPPSSPLKATSETLLLLNGSSGGIFDNAGCNDFQTVNSATISNSIKKFGTGSIKLNSATSDYLYLVGNNILNTGTADWTVEAWVYLNSMPTSDAWPTNWSLHMVLFSTGTPATGDGTDCIIGATKLMIQINDTQYASTSVHNMAINTWYYLTYVRFNNTMTFYVNGTSLGTVNGIPSNGTGSGTYIGCETGEGAYLNGYIDELRFSRFARYISPYFPLPTQSDQEAGPSATDPGQSSVSTFVAGDGLSSATAGTSAAAIKAQTGTNIDGVYWINLPTVGPTPVYCLMNSSANGGGWMMAMKATTGTTFVFTSTHWTTVTTLNPTDTTRANADAKFNTMNYFAATDIMALWPDITTNGGSLGTNPYSCWSWLESNFNGSTTTLINFFNTAGTYANAGTPSTGNYGGKFVKDAKTFSGWASGVFSSQADIRFYGFNFKNSGLSYGGNGSCRWGFGWNENGEGLYSSPATMATGGATGSNDVWGGIGLGSDGGSYSAGDKISCCQDSSGINRSARVEIYIR